MSWWTKSGTICQRGKKNHMESVWKSFCFDGTRYFLITSLDIDDVNKRILLSVSLNRNGFKFVLKHCRFLVPGNTQKIRTEIWHHFWLKMMMKSGLEKNILKFHGGLQRYLLTCQANSAFLGRFFLPWAAAILKALKEFQNEKFNFKTLGCLTNMSLNVQSFLTLEIGKVTTVI